jgi:GT2 family glycosyltransferase
VDVIILSNCINQECLNINNQCIHSLVNSEKNILFNLIILENNSNFSLQGFNYQVSNIQVIIPNEPFNFNRFLNIGLSLSKSDWVVFSNNDVIFHKDWFTEILKAKEQNQLIQSFCPFDRNSPYLSLEKFNDKLYHIGYRVPIEFVGWCFITDKSIFKRTGDFDEQFDLYFQDNDFAMTLKKNSIIHAMIPSSFVEHIGGYTTGIYDASKTEKYAEGKLKFEKKWKQSFFEKLKMKLRNSFRIRMMH